MKALLLRYSSRTRTLPIRLPAWAMVLASSWSLLAAPEVRTLTGGPSEIFPLGAAGYVDGDTATVAQFNTPYAIASDPTGNILFVADRDNNAIRQLDLIAGKTYTFATSRITLGRDCSLRSAASRTGAGAAPRSSRPWPMAVPSGPAAS